MIVVYLYYFVYFCSGLLAELFPSPVLNANNTLLHTVLWYKLHLLYVVQYCVTHQYAIVTPLIYWHSATSSFVLGLASHCVENVNANTVFS